MCYIIAETGDWPFCKAIMHHTRMRCAPTLPRDKITRGAGRRTPSPILSPLHLLERAQHNMSKAALLAGIDRKYLYRMMKKHGIVRKE